MEQWIGASSWRAPKEANGSALSSTADVSAECQTACFGGNQCSDG